MLVQDHPYKSPDIVRFLKHLLRHIPGKLLVIWDGAPIHRGQPVKDFLAQGGALWRTANAGKSWSSFSHRAYGELRSLPLRLEPRHADPRPLEIDDEQWDGPTWQELGDR